MFSTAHAAEPIVSVVKQAVEKACWQVFGARAPDYLEDVVQETWVKLWTYVTREREITNLSGLAYTVARTTAVDLYHHACRFAPLPNEASDHGTLTAVLGDEIDKRQAYRQLKVLLPKTPQSQRRLAVLTEALKGLRPREIAQHLHISDQQVERDRQYLAHFIRALECQYSRFLGALTARQQTIFRYALQGRRSCAIAHRLGISDATVSNELENIRTTFMKIIQGPWDDGSGGAKPNKAPQHAATADYIDTPSVLEEGEPLVASLLELPFFQEAPAWHKGPLEADAVSLDAADEGAPARVLFASFMQLPAFQERARSHAPRSDTDTDEAYEPQAHHETRRPHAQHHADCCAEPNERSAADARGLEDYRRAYTSNLPAACSEREGDATLLVCRLALPQDQHLTGRSRDSEADGNMRPDPRQALLPWAPPRRVSAPGAHGRSTGSESSSPLSASAGEAPHADEWPWAVDSPVPPDVYARVWAAARQAPPIPATTECPTAPGVARLRRRFRLPFRLRPAVGVLAAGLCLSLAVHSWLTVRWQARQADLTRQLAALQGQIQRDAQDSAALRDALTAAQAQVREAHAESRAWQARHADVTRQLAFQAQARQEAPLALPVVMRPGTDLRGRPYTAAALGQALFPEDRGLRFRGMPPAPVPKAPVVLPLTFAPASAAIEPLYSTDLDRLGTVLTQLQYAASRVRIVGYTDSLEAQGAETALALQRAEAVQRYLVEHFSIAPERLLVHGEGASQPRAPDTTPEGRSANRRVEIVAME